MLLEALDLELSFERGLAGTCGEIDWSGLVAAEVADPLRETAKRAGTERQPHEPELIVEVLKSRSNGRLDGPDLDRDAGRDEQVVDILILGPLGAVIDRDRRHLGQSRGLDRPIGIALDRAERADGVDRRVKRRERLLAQRGWQLVGLPPRQLDQQFLAQPLLAVLADLVEV